MKKDEFVVKRNQLVVEKDEYGMRKDELLAIENEVVADFDGATSALKHVGKIKPTPSFQFVVHLHSATSLLQHVGEIKSVTSAFEHVGEIKFGQVLSLSRTFMVPRHHLGTWGKQSLHQLPSLS